MDGNCVAHVARRGRDGGGSGSRSSAGFVQAPGILRLRQSCVGAVPTNAVNDELGVAN